MTRDWQRGMGERGGSSFGLARPPRATRWLLIANGLAFLLSAFLYFGAERIYGLHFVPTFALAPERWIEWFPFVPLWQLGTYAFLHDVGGLGHVLINMLTLYFFGTMLEGIVGTRRFAFAYAGAALAGALLYLACVAAGAAPAPALGASGAVLGVMVACATLRPNDPIYLFPLPFPLTLKLVALGLLAFNVFGAAHALKSGGDGIAYAIHLGGIAYGFACVRLGWIRVDPIAWWQARARRVAGEQREADAERVDRLLERIGREGIQSLSRAERDFLKKVSERK